MVENLDDFEAWSLQPCKRTVFLKTSSLSMQLKFSAMRRIASRALRNGGYKNSSSPSCVHG